MLVQLSIVVAIVLIIIGVLVATRKRKTEEDGGKSLIDVLLIKLKTVIGFYQVTHGSLQTFSYIKRPGSLQVIDKYSGILQMDVLQVASVHCLFLGLKVDRCFWKLVCNDVTEFFRNWLFFCRLRNP